MAFPRRAAGLEREDQPGCPSAPEAGDMARSRRKGGNRKDGRAGSARHPAAAYRVFPRKCRDMTPDLLRVAVTVAFVRIRGDRGLLFPSRSGDAYPRLDPLKAAPCLRGTCRLLETDGQRSTAQAGKTNAARARGWAPAQHGSVQQLCCCCGGGTGGASRRVEED